MISAISLLGNLLGVAGSVLHVQGGRFVLSLAIFLVTLSLVIWQPKVPGQPKGLGIGWSALAGAGVALAVGVVDLADVAKVWDIVWNATFTFVAVILISLLLDAAGFFKWAALHVARFARGRGPGLFVFVVLLGAAVACVFANDGAALILTPIVLEMLLALGFSPSASLAFVMATGFIADTSSLPLVVSNLVNLVSADYFHVGFERYAEIMFPIDLVSVLASLGVLWLYFRKSIPRHYSIDELEEPASAIRDRLTFSIGWAVLVLVLGGYFLADAVGVPISAIAGSGALVLVLVAGRRQKQATLGADPPTVDSQADPRQADHPDVDPRQADPPGVDPSRADPLAVGSRASGPLSGKPREPDTSKVSSHISSVPGSSIDVRRILWEAPWQVVIFSLGMYLVVFGVANAGLTSVVAFALEWLGKQGSTVGALVAGYGAAVLASITNNMPSVLVGALGIHAATQGGNQHAVQHALRHGAHIKQVFIFANVIGNDLGPKITPIGSLATLLWLHVLDRRGVHIGWGQYMKTGIVLVLPVLGVTLLAMAGWLRVLR